MGWASVQVDATLETGLERGYVLLITWIGMEWNAL
jgi:hypothetical protein